jgi:hypothetical protein
MILWTAFQKGQGFCPLPHQSVHAYHLGERKGSTRPTAEDAKREIGDSGQWGKHDVVRQGKGTDL